MGSPRIFCDFRLGPGAQFPLPQDAANHVAKALRLRAGDALVVFDGRGGEYEATILRIDKDRVDVKTGAFRDTDREPPVEVGLVQGLPEADKMDWILQKSVELGVAWIQPVVCERSVVRLSGDRAARRESHWQRVVDRRLRAVRPQPRARAPAHARLPRLGRAALGGAALDAGPGRGRAARRAGARPPGPSSCWSAPKAGSPSASSTSRPPSASRPLSLGPRVLRTETAPLAALSAMQALWGDFRR